MGFSFRKSIGIGPFRLNLSKSGVGVSTGVKGARISTGPSGTKVYGGWGPFRYQKQVAPGIGGIGSMGASKRGGWGYGTIIMLVIVVGVWAYFKYYKPAHEAKPTPAAKTHKAAPAAAAAADEPAGTTSTKKKTTRKKKTGSFE